jgi:hypothetical protein
VLLCSRPSCDESAWVLVVERSFHVPEWSPNALQLGTRHAFWSAFAFNLMSLLRGWLNDTCRSFIAGANSICEATLVNSVFCSGHTD